MRKIKVTCDTEPGVADAMVPGVNSPAGLDFYRRTLLGSS
jgi:hypothetical protein